MSTDAKPRTRTTLASGKRFYDWKGERFWSVTTIIGGGVPKPALLPWGIKKVAEGAVEAVERGSLAPMVEQDRDAAVQFLKGLPYAKRDRAAKLGSEVHEAIDAYNLGRPMPPWAVPIRPVMRQVEDFLRVHAPVVEASEESVYSREHAYAGTLDLIARFPRLGDGCYLVDWKTGKDVYPEVALQGAAYRMAEFLGAPDGTEVQMPDVDGFLVVHLTAEGWRLLPVQAGEQEFAFFLYAREIFRWQQQESKTAIGEPIVVEREEAA